jgi:hypothetical protein
MTPEELKELEELEELERLEAQFAEADTSPYPLKKTPLYVRGALQAVDDITPKDKKALAAKGVNVDYKLPVRESFIQSLATNKTEREAFIGSYLDTAFPGAPRRVGDSGEIEFLDPQTKRWTVAYPGAAQAVGEVPEVVLSTAGAFGGGVLGGMTPAGPAGVAAGGALGASAGQLAGDVIRQKFGQVFGINQSQTAGSMSAEALPDAVTTGAVDLGLGAVYGASRGLKAWFWGRQVLKPQEAQELLIAQTHADQLVNDINKEVGGLFQPSTARKAATHFSEAGEKLLSAESQSRTNPFIGHPILKNQQQNERALDMYFDNVTLGQRMGSVGGPSEGGTPLRTALDDEKFNYTRQAVAERATAQDAAAQGLNQLPASAERGVVGKSVRDAVSEKYQIAKQKTDKAYADYKSAIKEGPNRPSPVQIPWSREVKLLQKSLRQAIERSPRERSKDARKALLMQTDEPISLSDLDDTLKDLRDDIRRGMKGKLDAPLNLRDAKRLEKSLASMRNKYLEKNEPEAYNALLQAERAQSEESNLFRYGLTKNLLVQEGKGRFKLTDSQVIGRILKNEDAGAAREIAEIVKSNPDALSEVQNLLFAVYRKGVDPKGASVPSFEGHKKVMAKYGPIFKEFFTPEQAAQLDKLGGFAEVIAKNSARISALNRAWAKDFKGRLRSFSAEDLVEAVNSNKFSVDEVRKLSTIANAYGEDVVKSWKAGIAEDLRHRLFKGDHIDPARLQELVSDPDKMIKLSSVFGMNYTRHLRTLNDGMKMITRISRDIEKFQKSTLFTDIARMWYAPPLSRAGRVVTLGQNNRSREYFNNVYKALSDPEYLAEMASRTERTMRAVTALNLAGTSATNLARDEEYRE